MTDIGDTAGAKAGGDSAAPPTRRRSFVALRHRDFRLFTLAYFLATIAMFMQGVALGWQVYHLTGSVFDLGLFGLAEFLPLLSLALVTGHVADRYDRRIVTALSFALEFLCAALLILLTVIGVSNVWPFLAVAMLMGVGRAFAAPAGRAMPPTLVPAEDFPNAIAWSSIVWDAAVVGGPVLGGLLYLAGPTMVYGSAGGFFILAALLMIAVRPRPIRHEPELVTWTSVLAGVQLIRRTPILLGAISLDLFAVLFGGATILLPAFAQDILHTDSVGLGILRAAPAVGAVAMALYLTRWPIERRVGHVMFLCVAIFGAATIVFGLSTSFWLSCAALFVIGGADMVSVFIRVAIVPAVTPDRLRGRVLAVENIFIGASNELGAFESGVAAALFGTALSVALGGAATIIVVLAFLGLFPALRALDRFPAMEQK
ncbi:MAG: MFS transporter [Dongiaceae bacterium]